MSSSPLRNFHLPLPSETYDRLKEEAARQDKPATSVARDAIEEWLRERRKLVVREEIAAYASRMAGGRAALDHELEQAGVDHLLHDGER
jgi:predicted transcriptional regulator